MATSRTSARSSWRSWRWTTTSPRTSPTGSSPTRCSPTTRSVGRAAGTAASVEVIAPEDVRAFFWHWYRPATMVFAAAGRVEHEQVVAEVELRFDAPAGGPVPRVPPRHWPPNPWLSTGAARSRPRWRWASALARHDADREALDVVNHTLGGGLSSRLFEEIRERRGLAYSVGSGTSA